MADEQPSITVIVQPYPAVTKNLQPSEINVIAGSQPLVLATVEPPAIIIRETIGVQGLAGQTFNLVTQYAGEILGGHRVVFSLDNKLYYADHTVLGHANKVLGITKGASNINEVSVVQTYGSFEEPSWNWDLDKPVYLGTNGLLTQITPTTGFILIVGFPMSSTNLFVDIDKPIILG